MRGRMDPAAAPGAGHDPGRCGLVMAASHGRMVSLHDNKGLPPWPGCMEVAIANNAAARIIANRSLVETDRPRLPVMARRVPTGCTQVWNDSSSCRLR